jgi:hypothetical protein
MSTPGDNRLLVPMSRWRVAANGDFLTTALPTPAPPGAACDGQWFYIPAQEEPDTHPLYRLFSPGIPDHMDSPTEGGYTRETLLGHPSDASDGVTESIWRWHRPASGEHVTGFGDEDLTPNGYQPEGELGYGYRRYRSDRVAPLEVNGTAIRVVANLAAGGAISELWWNGKQFVNQKDYGRLMQIACNLNPVAESDNPTEGGDVHTPPAGLDARWSHGSPLINAEVNGTVLTTACHPMQFRPEGWGGDSTHPVMWKGTFEKEVELDWGGRPQVIRWETRVTFPHDEHYLDLEIVAAFLTPDFNRFYAFDASIPDPSSTLFELTDIALEACKDPNDDPHLHPSSGGAPMATADGSFALGVYRRIPPGEDGGFGLCNLAVAAQPGDLGGFESNGSNKLSAHYRKAPLIPAGQHVFTVFLLVGSVDDVLREARQLFLDGL